MHFLKTLRRFDWFLFLPMFLLISYGLVVVLSFSVDSARHQLIVAGAGLIGYFLLSWVDYRIWRFLAIYLYGGACILLLATFLGGLVTRGSSRWLSLGGFVFQPSEFSKLAVIVGLAWVLTQLPVSKQLYLFLSSLVFALIPASLVFLQPDLGTALLVLSIWLVLVVTVGTKLKYLVLLGVLGLIVSIPAWFLIHDYQRDRILTFINPSKDPLGAGYHVLQSQIAIGSGLFWGRGYGRGTQSHLKFLPDFETDFIFAALAEEWGFVGAMLLLALFGLLAWRILRVARRSKDLFACLVAVGVLALLSVQVAINIGMNLGLMPVTGIPLPLISVGGSSMLATLLALGLVQSIAMRS